MLDSLKKIRSELGGIYSENEIQLIFHLVAEKITGLTKSQLITNKNTIFSDLQNNLFDEIIVKLKKGEPVQYVIGETWFYDMKFSVDNSVLIPRPETEELVDWIMNDNNTVFPFKILDIGTGSGCIAISLKSVFRNSQITGSDISPKALVTARNNAVLNNQEVDFRVADITKLEPRDEMWDIIVSNPPYITENEKSDMQKTVLDFEPHTALFVYNDDPLYFYSLIADYASENLAVGGKLYFEINRNSGQQCIALLGTKGFRNIEIKRDISGNDRMIKAEK